MKSRVTIDLDFDNNPIIKIEYQESEDVRDKLVKRFLERFATESCWASLKFDIEREYAQSHNLNAGVSIVSPIHPKDLQEHIENMQKCLDGYKQLLAEQGKA